MRKRVIGAAVMVPALLGGALGTAGSAAAADEWIMPDVRTEVLQKAITDVQSVVGDAQLKFAFVPRNVNQKVYNYANWAVCSTSPSREKAISKKTLKVAFSLRRLNEKC